MRKGGEDDMTDEPFDKLSQMIERGMADAAASCVEDRVIAVGIMRAACTAYLAAHHPENWSEFGAHVSRVVQYADRKAANNKTLF